MLLAGYTVGLSAGYWLDDVAGTTHLTLMLANLAEIILAVLLLQRSQYARNFYFDINSAVQLGLYGILLPGLLGGFVAVLGAFRLTSMHWSEIGIAWSVNSVVCNASIIPLLLLIKHHRWHRWLQSHLIFQLLLLLGYTALILKYFPDVTGWLYCWFKCGVLAG